MCTFIYKKVGNNYSILTMYAQIQIVEQLLLWLPFTQATRFLCERILLRRCNVCVNTCIGFHISEVYRNITFYTYD